MSGMGPIIYIQSTSNVANNFKTPAQYHNNTYIPDNVNPYKPQAAPSNIKIKGDSLVIMPTTNSNPSSNLKA